MPASLDLRLHEEILLLALRDAEGTIETGSMYQYGIGGALLAELLMAGDLALQGEGKKRKVVVAAGRTSGDRLLDEGLDLVRRDQKGHDAKHWVQKFGNLKDLKHRVAESLVRRGILREEQGTVLLFFSQKKYPEMDPRPEQRLVERLRKAVLGESRDVAPRTVALISLAHNTGLLKHAFDQKELKARKERIRALTEGEICGAGAKEAVEAVQAAIMVAVIVPTLAAAH